MNAISCQLARCATAIFCPRATLICSSLRCFTSSVTSAPFFFPSCLLANSSVQPGRQVECQKRRAALKNPSEPGQTIATDNKAARYTKATRRIRSTYPGGAAPQPTLPTRYIPARKPSPPAQYNPQSQPPSP